MKVLYSQLKKYLPDLKADAKEVANVYTLTGFMIDKFFEVEYQGKKDFLLDLEVRQNRADAFGVIGLARELSAYFNIPLKLPQIVEIKESSYQLPIEIKAKKEVKRVSAVKISGIKIDESPKWIKEYLAHYDINSINNLVDITNYVMLETAIPSHAFDVDLTGDKLIWEMNPSYKKFVTLSGEELEIDKNVLLISNGKKPLALSMIGAKEDSINPNTKNIVLEVGIYDPGLIRRNSRKLKVLTEAGSRLEKYLDPDSTIQTLNWLVQLILEHCGGKVDSKVFDEYLQKAERNPIEVDLNKVQQVAGIPIEYSESISYLERLGFKILNNNEENHIVTVERPQDRLDIEIEYDVFEEIIRLKGFDKVPTDKLEIEAMKDITPSHIILFKKVEEILSSRGFDEVRSWVLVDQNQNQICNFAPWQEIQVTNSINEEVPFLRQSISVSMFGQVQNYLKNNIQNIRLFEQGKIFGKLKNYIEINSLGMITQGKDLNGLKIEVEALLGSLGVPDLVFKKNEQPPKSAHPLTCWNIFSGSNKIGIIYVSNTDYYPECCVAELNEDLIDSMVSSVNNESTQEVTQKIVTLDANVELSEKDDVTEYLVGLLKNEKDKIWYWEIVDQYNSKGRIKYTVRVSYSNLNDQEAKKLHAEIFK